MAPRLPAVSLGHRLRTAHPLRPVMRRQLGALDRADAATLRTRQERRLRMLILLASTRSAYHRRLFRENGIDPRAIRTLEDLPQLPYLTRDQLIERFDDFPVYHPRLTWTASSSGTSGRPVRVRRTAGSSVYELCALERQWGWFGLRPGARRIVLRGSDFTADEPGKVTKRVPGANQLLVSSFHLIPERVDEILAEVRDFDAEAIEGWPSSIALLATLIHDRGERLPLAAVVTSSEVMCAGRRALLTEVFGGPIIDHYGQTERVLLAGNCEHGGYHAFSDYGIVELLPVDGVANRWELVGTPLHNWGFPMFRYRTGDEVGPAPDGPCPCGRAFPLLGTIAGRIEDSFTAADGRPIPLPATVIDDLQGVREAQIAQLSRGRFEVRVTPAADFQADAVAATVRRNVERLIGTDQTVTVRVLDRIPRTGGGKLKSAVVECE